MKFIKNKKNIQKEVENILRRCSKAKEIIDEIYKNGGKAFLVGGAVRDLFLGLHIKDLDIEVHFLKLAQLENILKKFGHVNLVGKAFGVFKIQGLNIDWSLPRSDKSGRKPKVEIDSAMGIKESFMRRDLTINAMGIDLETFEVLDPFFGLKDLKNGILRAVDKNFFLEDPLRFFRVMQFIARFEMHPDKELNNICKNMNINQVSIERISMEMEKLMLKSKKPSMAFRWLLKIGRLKEIFPEIYSLKEGFQNFNSHSDVDLFEHTMRVLDAAAAIKCSDKMVLMYSALCHGFGKLAHAERIKGTWRNFKETRSRMDMIGIFLKRVVINKDLISKVSKLVRCYMFFPRLKKMPITPEILKKWAARLAPEVSLKMLAYLYLADIKGSRGLDNGKFVKEFLYKAKRAGVLTSPEPPVLQGKDLLKIGLRSGPGIGEILRQAYKIQIKSGIRDKDQLIKLVIKP